MPRKRLAIHGTVQGVGFRPFVYQAAQACQVAGWVLNDSHGVLIEVEGGDARLSAFLERLRQPPPLAVIARMEIADLPSTGEEGFVIRSSPFSFSWSAEIAADAFVCADCLHELRDPRDRRYRYPFINCTNCGPRYTIVTGIPYDRRNTTMGTFPMCPACRVEFADPASRRFHAQPNACPTCGPQLTLRDAQGRPLPVADPLVEAVELLRQGRIVAIKGLGGYHLAVDATNHEAVRELRRRKVRDEKPFALMARDLAGVARFARLSTAESALLQGVERPIVLVPQASDHGLSPAVAPHNRYFGVMLPYTPLHHLLLQDHFSALVMTSGNRSDEPIAFDDGEALERLAGIADGFLTHDRRIQTRTDDSIVRVMAGRPLLLRRSRGYVPRSLPLPHPLPEILAVGGELKNTVCLTRQSQAYLSQHVGDLKSPSTYASFETTIEHLQRMLQSRPQIVAYDLHPDYYPSRYAQRLNTVRKVGVQHHHAHLASCLAENGAPGEALGVIFDGLGYGSDGCWWGGEFLVGGYGGFRRAGHFAYVPMPGGDAATREPWRMALSYLLHTFGGDLPWLPFLESLPPADRELLTRMIERGVNAPLTSSCGRLFDGVAALLGLRQKVCYEGQAALELEMILDEGETGSYPVALGRGGDVVVLDPGDLIRGIVADLHQEESAAVISARFHNSLAHLIHKVCCRLRRETGLQSVALSGGVFQNRTLTERAVTLLQGDNFTVYTHSLVPPNDGGLALGQAMIAGFPTP